MMNPSQTPTRADAPSLNRRHFLFQSAIAATTAFATVPKAASAELEPYRDSRRRSSPPSWDEVRKEFNLAPDLVHLSSFFLASHPRQVREAIARYREAIDADPVHAVHAGCWGENGPNLTERVKRAAADYIGGRFQDVTLTQSTTMGLALAYWGVPLRSGDEILTTTHEHQAHDDTIRIVAKRAGATIRKIKLYDRLEDLPSITESEIVDRIQRALTPSTRCVGLTWVHSSSGLRLPIRSIAAAIRQRAPNALIIVDGVHGFGVVDASVADLGIDVFVAGTHKWILGPRGTGIVWAQEAAWSALEPFMQTNDGDEPWKAWLAGRSPTPPARADWFTPGGFKAFEYEWAAADAFEFHRSIGRQRVADRITSLNTRLKDGLAEMRHVKLWTPRNPRLSAGLVGFDIAGLTAEQAQERLWAHKIVATASPYARPVARLAAGIMNNEDDIEKALRAVRKLAAA